MKDKLQHEMYLNKFSHNKILSDSDDKLQHEMYLNYKSSFIYYFFQHR